MSEETAPTNRRISASRTAIAVGVTGVAVLVTSAGLLLTSVGGPAGTPAKPPRAASAGQAAQLHSAARGGASLATVLQTVPRYASPGERAAGTVSDQWYDRPSVLPVIATSPGWVEVRLAQRPNGSMTWLPASDVKLSSTPYRIVVNTTTTHIALYDQGRLVFSAPAGLGTPEDPTPAGEYFVAFDEQPPQPNPGYGPFIMVTSAHSPGISDWEGSGDAVIGIHGPLGDDSEIGATGARISHGCIRLHDQALQRLAEVPPGTPIDVVS